MLTKLYSSFNYLTGLYDVRPLSVLVCIEGLASDRGDNRGYVGIGKTMAKKLGADYQQYDAANTSLPDGYIPDIIVGPDLLGFSASGAYQTYFKMNEWSVEQRDKGLYPAVPHEITPDILETEGQAFRARYPTDKPIIGIILAGNDLYDLDSTGFKKSLGELDSAMIFLCPMSRTREAFRLKVVEMMQREYPHFDIHSVSYEECVADYNPYFGLLDQAQYLILDGASSSVETEILTTGKPIHATSDEYCVAQFLGDKYIHLDRGERLSDLRFDPAEIPNATELVAEQEIEKYYRSWHPMVLLKRTNRYLEPIFR